MAKDYLAARVDGFEAIRSWFDDVDVENNCRVCGLDVGAVREFTRLFATRKTAMRSDLGILMGRHSTLSSYLELILLALTGRIGVSGGNVFLGHLMPMGTHTPEEDPGTWKTVITNIPLIMGVFPPNVMPEEIDNDHPQRIRALIVSRSNPLRSYADTSAYEKAFAKLDLLVTIEVAMSETTVRRWSARTLIPAYLEYASLGPSRTALHLGLCEPPGQDQFHGNLPFQPTQPAVAWPAAPVLKSA